MFNPIRGVERFRNRSPSAFRTHFDKQQRFHDMLQKFVIGFIAFVFLAIIAYWIFVAVLVVKVADKAGEQDFSNGIKPVIEKMWCGKPGCLDK